MKKKELIDAIIETTARKGAECTDSGKMKQSRLQTEAMLEAFGEATAKELTSGGEITIPGVGKLKVKGVSERKARNPRSGKIITVPAHSKVVFIAAKSLKEAVR